MHKTITVCRCCGSGDLVEYLNLGTLPLASKYHKGEEQPSFPLAVNFCRACSHSQLSVVVHPDLIFKNYLNLSGTSQSWKDHCKALAEKCASLFAQDEPPRVLDIGCNDGTLLDAFIALGWEAYGIDPAANMAALCHMKGIEVVPHYFNSEWASKQNLKYEIIAATNVFSHIDNLVEFFTCCDKLLFDTGRLVLEFPYCEKMIGNNEFDLIHHEHLNYFTVTSFAKLCENCHWCVESVEKINTQGGSLRFFLRKDFGQGNCKEVGELVAHERVSGLFNEELYHSFAERVQHNREVFLSVVGDLQAQGKKVVGYGGCTKASTAMNYFGFDLEYIVDDNPHKWLTRIPGSGTLIINPADLTLLSEPLYIVVLAWNYYREIVGRVQSLRPDQQDTFIVYVPEVTMEM